MEERLYSTSQHFRIGSAIDRSELCCLVFFREVLLTIDEAYPFGRCIVVIPTGTNLS
jgi:hypothetical protein